MVTIRPRANKLPVVEPVRVTEITAITITAITTITITRFTITRAACSTRMVASAADAVMATAGEIGASVAVIVRPSGVAGGASFTPSATCGGAAAIAVSRGCRGG